MYGLNLQSAHLDQLLDQEWLTVNKAGGYASSTIPGLNTRKYHGLLVAAMAPPVRRMVLLSRVEETVRWRGWNFALSCNEYPGTIHPRGDQSLRAFQPDPFPRWAYQGEGWTLEKSLRLLNGQNTVVLSYALLAGDEPISLELRPLLALRGIHELMYQWNGRFLVERKGAGYHRVSPTARTPEVFFAHDGKFESQACWYLNTIYRREQDRGYGGLEDLWNPGIIKWNLLPGQTVHFACSADPIDFSRCVEQVQTQFAPAPAKSAADGADPSLGLLRRAADQFVLQIPTDAAAPTTMIAGQYPWSPPAGRYAMIGLPGLLLVPGRYAEARSLLLAMTQHLREGLMPSEWAENGTGPVYRGADTSLWFINAVHHYVRYSGDERSLHDHFGNAILAIIESYRHGTLLGISTDAQNLITSHQPGAATSWMDAKVGDWVVTPRGGRTVELNALWYNALRIAGELLPRCGHGEQAEEYAALAERVRGAFNERFWNEQEQCCFDVIDDHGRDPAIRPNQIFAASLPFPVLPSDRQAVVLETIFHTLLTPLGLRTLAPGDSRYQGHYGGNVVQRDRAYHQGSAYPWLLGPLLTAYLRVHGRGDGAKAEARTLIEGCLQHLGGPGLGQICELFDGDKPHRPGGAIASPISVAEILRCYAEDLLDLAPLPPEAMRADASAGKKTHLATQM